MKNIKQEEKLRYCQYFNPYGGPKFGEHVWWQEFKLVKHLFSKNEWVPIKIYTHEEFKKLNTNNCIVEYYKNFEPGVCESFKIQDPNVSQKYYRASQM